MVSEVISVGPNSSVQQVARVLLANRISAVLVMGDESELLGIISEGDLLRRVEVGTEQGAGWWVGRQSTGVRQVLAEDFVKSHSQKGSDVMSRYVITAEPDTPLKEIAALFEANHIKRIPIVESDKVVGIVSCADFLGVLARMPERKLTPLTSEDTALGEAILASLKKQPWLRSDLINIIVHNGVVELWGIVASDAEKDAVRVAAEITCGVRGVNDYLTVHAGTFKT